MPTVLEYQLDLLKSEIETINSSIRQMDDITKSVKEWTVGIWAASVGGALVTPRFTVYAGVTAAVPLLFWFVDTWYRRIQRKFIWRSIVISKFLNGSDLVSSFERGQIAGITLLDPKNRTGAGEGYAAFIDWQRIMRFRSVSIFYGGMCSISLLVGAIGCLQLL